jgi:hypothetical protein
LCQRFLGVIVASVIAVEPYAVVGEGSREYV